MKKFTVFALVCALALGACSALQAPTNAAPTMDVAGTVNSIAQTSVAQTLTAQPSPTPTLVPDTSTPPIADASATSSPIPNTDTPPADLTATIATATSGPEIIASTPTAAPGLPSLTPTLGVLTFGTLPPAIVPYIGATLVNKSERQAYISLQVVTEKGGPTIIEYPVEKVVKVQIPVGSYTYVVWVGGRQIVGNFKISKNDELTITIYKDKVVVK